MINWFAATNLLEELRVINTQGRQCPDYLLNGLKHLQQALKHWNNEKYVSILKNYQQIFLNFGMLLFCTTNSKKYWKCYMQPQKKIHVNIHHNLCIIVRRLVFLHLLNELFIPDFIFLNTYYMELQFVGFWYFLNYNV